MTGRPRFGVWAPVYGNHGARHHPLDAPDASYRRTRDLVLRAEAAGFDSTLVAQHVVHPSDIQDEVWKPGRRWPRWPRPRRALN